jgi:carboxypeptidase family protein
VTVRPSLVHLAVVAVVVAACTASEPPSPLPSAAATSSPRPTRTVTVQALGPSGPVAGAQICASEPGGSPRCGTAASDGRIAIDLARGTYALRATPPQGQRLGEGVATVDLSESTSAVVMLPGKATISGTIADTTGRKLRDAEVCAHSATTEQDKCARTGDDGRYVVEVVPGIQKIEVNGPPDGSHLLPQWARGRLSSDEADIIDTRQADVTGVDVVLRPGVVLSGTITDSTDGKIVEAAQVCTYPFALPAGWDCGLTDKRGHYALVREPDQYYVWIIPPGDRGSRLMYERYDHVLESADASAFDLFHDRTLDVALTNGLFLRGRVTTTDGRPVVLAHVCVDTPFPTGRICRLTADDGSYEVATRPERYIVSVEPPDGSDVIAGYYPDVQPDWTKATPVRIGPVDAHLDIRLPTGVRLTGTIRNARAVPVESATINVNDASGPRYFGSTDIHGRYAIALPPGSYTVDVFPPNVPALAVVGQRVDVAGDTGYDVTLPDVPGD